MARRPGLPERHCVYCRKSEGDADGLSSRGVCRECAREALEQNAAQLSAKSGPYFQLWVRKNAEAAQRELAAA